jgi:uncharacterized protein (TIGR02391 family)
MTVVIQLSDNQLQAVCDVLGDTSRGLTGSEIGRFLRDQHIDDPYPTLTKRHRLFGAFKTRRDRDGNANHIIRFIKVVMDPVRYVDGDHAVFEERHERLNVALSFAGIEIAVNGEIRSTHKATTITEADQRAKRLRRILQERQVHADVLRYCRAELVSDNYFHAVLEATKSVAEKIREKSGLTADGAELIDRAFGGVAAAGKTPLLAFNSLRKESEKNEQNGLMHLMKGLFSAFRNPTAHEPRLTWQMSEEDALDVLTIASMLHRRLDQSVKTR